MIETVVFFSLAFFSAVFVFIWARAWYRLGDSVKESSHPFQIAVLGPSGVGKTLFLSALMRQLTEAHEIHESLLGKYLSDEEEKKWREIGSFQKDPESGYYIPGKRSTRHIVETELKRYWESKTRGTEKPENFYLEVWGRLSEEKSIHRKIMWRDIPGGYFEVQEDWCYNGIGDILNQSRGIFLLIDAPGLVRQETSGEKTSSSPDARSASPGFQNYVEAVSCRLRAIKKQQDRFPVWLIFTKGDMLPPELQDRPEKDWLMKTSQVSALAAFESEQIAIFAGLVSIDREKSPDLYQNIGLTMKKVYPVILEEISKKEEKKNRKKRRTRRLFLTVFLFWLLFLLEGIDAYRFSRLPAVRGEDTLKEEQANAYVGKLSLYERRPCSIGFYVYRRNESRKQLSILQKKVSLLIEERMNTLDLKQKKYRSYLQNLVDSISSVENVGTLLDDFPADFAIKREFVDLLQQWDQLVGQDDPSDYKVDPKTIIAFYTRLPQHQIRLKEKVKEIVKRVLERTIDEAQEEATSCVGSDFYPQRLEPLISWYKDFGNYFPDLDEKYFRLQVAHWEYAWKRYLQMFEAQIQTVKKAEILREFREQMPEQTFAFQKCPDFLLKDWKNVTSGLLASWDPEDDPNQKRKKDAIIEWFKFYLSEMDSLLVECRQFEKKIDTLVKELFQAEKERGQKLNKIVTEMENFFHQYGNEKKIREILARWQQRYEDLKKFQDRRAVKLIVREYGCRKDIPSEIWKDETWESLYLYLRIELEGMKPIILDLREGNLSYNGGEEIKEEVLWKPWTEIRVKFLDADGDIDKEALVNDDVLHTIEFKNVFSIVDLTERRIEKTEKNEALFWLKIDLVEAAIPQWLLDIYKSLSEK